LFGTCTFIVGVIIWPILLYNNKDKIRSIFQRSLSLNTNQLDLKDSKKVIAFLRTKPRKILIALLAIFQQSICIKLYIGITIALVFSMNSSILVRFWNGKGIELFGVIILSPDSNINISWYQAVLAIAVFSLSFYISILQWSAFVPTISACFILRRVSIDFKRYVLQEVNTAAKIKQVCPWITFYLKKRFNKELKCRFSDVGRVSESQIVNRTRQ